MRFLPAEVEPYVTAVEDGGAPTGYPRRTAVHALVRAYASGRRLLTGIVLWLLVVAAVVVLAVGALAVTFAITEAGSLALGVGGLLAAVLAVVGGGWAALLGADLLRAGGRLSRAAETWMTAVPEPKQTLAHGAHGLLSALRPELYPRLILASLTGLAAVLCTAVVGYSLAQVAGAGPLGAAGNVVMAVASGLLAVVSAVAAVALWRGLSRVQRGLVKDPGAMA